MLSLFQGFNLITQYERFDLIDLLSNTEQFYSNLIAELFEFASLDNRTENNRIRSL